MKIVAVFKERQGNIDNKEFFHVDTNGVTNGIFASSISEAGNGYLVVVIKMDMYFLYLFSLKKNLK